MDNGKTFFNQDDEKQDGGVSVAGDPVNGTGEASPVPADDQSPEQEPETQAPVPEKDSDAENADQNSLSKVQVSGPLPQPGVAPAQQQSDEEFERRVQAEVEKRTEEQAKKNVVLKVKAVGGDVYVGYYKLKRKRNGDVFILDKPGDFSPAWMMPIGWEPHIVDKGRAAFLKKNVVRHNTSTNVGRQHGKHKAQAGEAMSLSQVAGVDRVATDRSPNPAETVI